MKYIGSVFFSLLCTLVLAQPTRVMVMEIKSEIDPRTNRYVELALAHAQETKADILLIEMDTYGGVLTDAKEIVDQLMRVEKPVWVFINADAASAGALISIACDSIYMAPGASIGAATVVDATGEKAPDKYQSYMRSIMRSTAEENGRDPRIAEGMVDERLVIDSIKQEGQIITFSTSEAIRYGFCEGKVESIEEILERNHVVNYELDRFKLSRTDTIIAFFLNPFISGILILIIIGGIYYELQTPGIGFPLAAATVALILYLVPYYLNGLAENWEIIALFIGFALIFAEIFIFPGFGVSGVAGITLTVGSLILIMVNNDFFDFEFVSSTRLLFAVASAFGGMLGGVILLFVAGAQLPNSRFFRNFSLAETQEKSQGYTVTAAAQSMAGKQGTAYSVLRPGGKVLIDGQLYDAFTRGEFVDKGETIMVIDDETTTLRVKKV